MRIAGGLIRFARKTVGNDFLGASLRRDAGDPGLGGDRLLYSVGSTGTRVPDRCTITLAYWLLMAVSARFQWLRALAWPAANYATRRWRRRLSLTAAVDRFADTISL